MASRGETSTFSGRKNKTDKIIKMSEPKNSRKTAEESVFTFDSLVSDTDEGLVQFKEHEEEEEQRFITSRSVFNKVIGRATSYKRLLLTIKTEYEDVISELKRREDEDKKAQRTVASLTSLPKSLVTCKRRAEQLRVRISDLQSETSNLLEEQRRQKSAEGQSTWIPGLTVAESEDPEALDEHRRHLEAQRAALLDRKSGCVPLEVKAQLDAELQSVECHREELSTENHQLKVLFKRLRCVCDHLSRWEEEEEEEEQVSLEELLGSTLENIRQTSVTDDDDDEELFETDEPTGVNGSQLVADYLDRFIELFDSAQYEDAALVAARSPQGVLRNVHTMEMFKGVTAAQGSVPPLLLFFQALLITAPPGTQLSAPLSLHCVLLALRHGASQLVTHAITQNKLTFSEHLGDILIEHALENASVADLCLALATVVYEACGLNRKTALSMCRRGLIHSAAKFMHHCKDLTAEDFIWVLCCSPSLTLLQLLTEPQHSVRAAILSVGRACSTLLVDPHHGELALQLLDSFVTRGREVLENVILEDSDSSVDVWINVASLCSELKRPDLNRSIMSVLLDQSGTRVLSPDLEGARLMEHVFL